jgi:hypothetical protein
LEFNKAVLGQLEAVCIQPFLNPTIGFAKHCRNFVVERLEEDPAVARIGAFVIVTALDNVLGDTVRERGAGADAPHHLLARKAMQVGAKHA